MYIFLIKVITFGIGVVSLIQLTKTAAINLDEFKSYTNNAQTALKFRIDYIEFSPNDKMFDYGTIRSRKYNRTTYVLDGYYDVLSPITDDLSINVYIFTWQGNEYRKLGERFIPKVCSALQNETLYLPKAIPYTNVDPNFKCPFEPMRIFIYNYSMPDLPSFYVSGDRFRVNMTWLDLDEAILASYAVYIVKET